MNAEIGQLPDRAIAGEAVEAYAAEATPAKRKAVALSMARGNAGAGHVFAAHTAAL